MDHCTRCIMPHRARIATICLLLPLACCLGLPSNQKDARILLSQVASSVHSGRDVLTSLPENQKAAWAHDDGKSIEEMIEAFTNVAVDVHIFVKLVGFDGGGQNQLSIQQNDLLRHLNALHSQLESIVLQPTIQHLVLQPTVHFQVRKVSPFITQRLDAALRQTRSAAVPENPLLRIPYQVVDDIIQADFQEGQATFTIYLIQSEAMQDLNYAYDFDAGIDSEDKGCRGAHWLAPKPYMWIDITAGATYGPGAGHKGQVFFNSLPHPRHYKASMLNRAILPDLTALVWSACKHLVWPPVAHNSLRLWSKLQVAVVHMHDTLGPPPDRLNQEVIRSVLATAVDTSQEVTVQEKWLSFAKCDLCMSAYTSALKVQPVHGSPAAKILDSVALHAALAEYRNAILAYAGLKTEDSTTSGAHILPVFVFDLAEADQAVLLDGQQKATAFADMVVAVSSRAPPVTSHFMCDYEPVQVAVGDVTREVLAGLLTSGWGVVNTSTSYTAAAGEGSNYMWSVGNTPFGPLSRRTALSAPIGHTLLRNQALLQLNVSASRIMEVLRGFGRVSSSGKLDRNTAGRKQQTEIMQRLNLAFFKLHEAARLLGEWHAAAALNHARSLQHDAAALEHIALQVNERLVSRLHCEGATSLWSLWWAPVGSLALWPLAVWLRQRLYAPKLDKIY